MRAFPIDDTMHRAWWQSSIIPCSQRPHLVELIQLISHHLDRSDLADVTELEERLERGSVGIIALDPSMECLPGDPRHLRQARVGLVVFQVGCITGLLSQAPDMFKWECAGEPPEQAESR